ncbi:methyltransferase domain-containing protein [Longispora sp. K20-0274]|uniref:methyltransferase domain-containing protein n=1 Tax=Longispora sp. K20-0274 TaxID=3088255 RepID=UPI00399A3A8C
MSRHTSARVGYLDHVAASGPGREYKGRVAAALGLVPGMAVLDVGCGPGADLAGLVAEVGPTGAVLAVDADPAMVAVARRRFPGADVRLGDAHALPVADATIDRTLTDRVLQHVADPAGAVAELRRVLRPGGVAVIADNDWDTLVIDDPDLDTSRAYTRYVRRDVVRNAAVGRQAARLCAAAGFAVRDVAAVPVVFRDAAAAERILRITEVTGRAVLAGAMDREAARAWLGRLTGGGPFLACATVFVTTATVPVPTRRPER